MTAERSYLTPEVLERKNLTVATQAFARRILFDNTAGKLRATGVEFSDVAGRIFQVKAKKEVVLAYVSKSNDARLMYADFSAR